MTTSQISKAASLLKSGKLVAFPTETVYGLGADANNKEAVQQIFAVKKRPVSHPLIVHLAHLEQISLWVRALPPLASQLANKYWPGPLTLILPKHPAVLADVTGGQDTVAIRIPNHPIAQALLKTFGGGIAAPSANQFTHVSPTTAEAVEEELGNQVDMILDGGASSIGLESTIIDLSQQQPYLLRPGHITRQQLETYLNIEIKEAGTTHTTKASGRHALHYAPLTQTLILSHEEIIKRCKNRESSLPVVIITHSAFSVALPASIEFIQLSSNPVQYAHDLYHTLRQADQLGTTCLWIEAVPKETAWDAIRDRLQKASGSKT